MCWFRRRQKVRRLTTGRNDVIAAARGLFANLPLHRITTDARMRAIYSSHARISDEDRRLFQQSWWTMDAALLEEERMEGGPEIIDDGHGPIGGDLVAAVLGIIKGMVGPAILYLPHGFATAGYAIALPMLVICTAIFLYSASCLLQAWQHESKPASVMTVSEGTTLLEPPPPPRARPPRPMLSYPELAYRALGERGEALVKAGIALMQSGVCLTYLIFVPQNLHTSFLLLTGWDIPPKAWLIVMIGVQIPLSWIRDIRKLTPTNLLANGLILYGLLTCIGFAIREVLTPGNNTAPKGNGTLDELWAHLVVLPAFADGWFLFIGTSVRLLRVFPLVLVLWWCTKMTILTDTLLFNFTGSPF
jgi:proton-coupled amino acid transporter